MQLRSLANEEEAYEMSQTTRYKLGAYVEVEIRQFPCGLLVAVACFH